MQQPDKFKDYAALVCGQLRWKKARPVVAREIETHLRDQCDALVQSGMGEEEAIDESIRQMGDAVEIGTSLDRVHRPKPSWSLLVLTGILLLLGLLIQVFLIDDAYMLPRYTLSVVLGVGFFLGAYFADFSILGKWPLLIYVGVIVLVRCASVYSLRFLWISIYDVQLLLLLPLAYAALLYWMRGKKYLGLVLALVGLAIQCACCSIIPCMAGLLATAVTGLVLLAVAAWGDWFRIGKRRGMIILGALVLLGAAAVFLRTRSSASAITRFELAFHPELEPEGRGWLGMLIRETLAGARLLGEGTLSAYAMDAPMILRDSGVLLTYLIYRVGWISFFVILTVFLAFFAAAVHKCLKQKNMLGRLVSLSVILTLALQVLLYVCYNLGICLFGSISLPLISYGSTAMLVNMALIGVMLSAFRTGSLVRDGEQPLRGRATRSRWADRIRWKDGELTISFKRTISS